MHFVGSVFQKATALRERCLGVPLANHTWEVCGGWVVSAPEVPKHHPTEAHLRVRGGNGAASRPNCPLRVPARSRRCRPGGSGCRQAFARSHFPSPRRKSGGTCVGRRTETPLTSCWRK